MRGQRGRDAYISPYPVTTSRLVVKSSGSDVNVSVPQLMAGAKGGRSFGKKHLNIFHFKGTPLDISNTEGRDLLSPREQELCCHLRLAPRVYLTIKDNLLSEYHKHGNLKRAKARQMVKIDVNKTGKVYDFFVLSGWIKNPS